jgi:hypothetical protein
MVSISNVDYRTNVTGDIMDAHDGSYNQWTPGGPFYYYAMGYGTCKQGGDMCHGCGYGYSWIGVWKSSDMSNGSWTLVREARDDTWPKCTYFRVHTIYNPVTKLYILWVNLNGGPADFAVGTSKTPEGPFTHVHNVNAGRKSGGDFDILVDDDNSAYLIYTATQLGHTMTIEKLNDDMLRYGQVLILRLAYYIIPYHSMLMHPLPIALQRQRPLQHLQHPDRHPQATRIWVTVPAGIRLKKSLGSRPTNLHIRQA